MREALRAAATSGLLAITLSVGLAATPVASYSEGQLMPLEPSRDRSDVFVSAAGPLPPDGQTYGGGQGLPPIPAGPGADVGLDRFAQLLGVTSARLRAALAASLPTSPRPVGQEPVHVALPEDHFQRLAQNLGLSVERVRAALGQSGNVMVRFAGPDGGQRVPSGGQPDCAVSPLSGPNGQPLPSPDVGYAEMTDRLARRLGLGGDRVREALRQHVTPSQVPSIDDVVNRLAQNLGVSSDRVRQAFTLPSGCGFAIPLGDAPVGTFPTAPSQGAGPQLDRIAQTLGVSADRLRTVLRQTVPAPPPPALDDVVNRLAQSLGVSPDRLRQALRENLPAGIAPYGDSVALPIPFAAGAGQRGILLPAPGSGSGGSAPPFPPLPPRR